MKSKPNIRIFYLIFITVILVMSIGLPLTVSAAGCSSGEHDYTVTTKAATETEDGETVYACTLCGFKFSQILPATGHRWCEWITDKQPTCTQPGHKYRICTKHENDPHTEEETIPALGHKYTEKITPYTCEEDGFKTYLCERCGETYTQPFGEAVGHQYIEKITKEPDCEQEGEKTLTCEQCGDTYTEAIPALEHSYGEWITDKEPTESEEGHRCRVCLHDSSHIVEEAIDRLLPVATIEPKITEDTESPSFPNTMDVVLILLTAVMTIGFGIAICPDLYIIRWEKSKAISYADWLKKNG